MKITLEFTDAERFMKELPQFAKVIGFASQFVQFSRTGKKDGDIDIQADVPDAVIGPGGEPLVKAGDADRVIKAAKKVGAYVENAPEKAPEKPQDAPKETADKVSTETAKAPENAKSEAPADKEKPAEKAAEISEAEVKKALTWLARKDHKDDVRSILNAAGVRNFPELAKLPEKFPEVYKEATAKIKEYGGPDNG